MKTSFPVWKVVSRGVSYFSLAVVGAMTEVAYRRSLFGAQFQMVRVRDGGVAGTAEAHVLNCKEETEKAHWEWSLETSKPAPPVTCFLQQGYTF